MENSINSQKSPGFGRELLKLVGISVLLVLLLYLIHLLL